MKLVWICKNQVSRPRLEIWLMEGKDRCEFLPKKEDEGSMLDVRDSILVSTLCGDHERGD